MCVSCHIFYGSNCDILSPSGLWWRCWATTILFDRPPLINLIVTRQKLLTFSCRVLKVISPDNALMSKLCSLKLQYWSHVSHQEVWDDHTMRCDVRRRSRKRSRRRKSRRRSRRRRRRRYWVLCSYEKEWGHFLAIKHTLCWVWSVSPTIIYHNSAIPTTIHAMKKQFLMISKILPIVITISLLYLMSSMKAKRALRA